jgi:ring-1,2-phenylacetyl-CoA epoxidase subunit PaaB
MAAKDTQWPRYQVFIQAEPGDPFLDAGTIHATDAEMALLNARDVFARRPGVHSLWVVPAGAIYSKTRQELKAEQKHSITEQNLAARQHLGQSESQAYSVCCKPKSAGTQTYLGVVEASSPEEAMQKALETFSAGLPEEKKPFAWWVFPSNLVVQNDPEDAGSLFTPALDKLFRQSTDFHVVTAMKKINESRPVSQ